MGPIKIRQEDGTPIVNYTINYIKHKGNLLIYIWVKETVRLVLKLKVRPTYMPS